MSQSHNTPVEESFAAVSDSVLFHATNFGLSLRVCTDALDELKALKEQWYNGVPDEVPEMILIYEARIVVHKLLEEWVQSEKVKVTMMGVTKWLDGDEIRRLIVKLDVIWRQPSSEEASTKARSVWFTDLAKGSCDLEGSRKRLLDRTLAFRPVLASEGFSFSNLPEGGDRLWVTSLCVKDDEHRSGFLVFEEADREGTVDISKASQYSVKSSFATASMPSIAPPRNKREKFRAGLAQKQAYDRMRKHLGSTAIEVASIARPLTDVTTLMHSGPLQDDGIQRALPRTLLAFSTKQEDPKQSSVYLIVPSSDGSARTLRSFESAEGGTAGPNLTPDRAAEISSAMQAIHHDLVT